MTTSRKPAHTPPSTLPLPAPAPRKAGRPRSQASENAIMNATVSLLLEGGYAAVTIDRVAALAKASKGTIYRRWATKEHLIVATFSRFPPVQPRDRGDLLAELLDMHVQLMQVMKVSPLRSVMPILTAEASRNPSLAAELAALYEQRRTPARIAFRRALERGELPPDADTEFAIDLIYGAITVPLYLRPAEITQAWMTRLLSFVIAGLKATTPAAPSPGHAAPRRRQVRP